MNERKGLRRLFARGVHNRAGFTLVELIVVIAILGILAGVAVPVYNGYIHKADIAADEEVLAAVNRAFASACMVHGVDNYNTPNAKAKIDSTTKAVGSVTGTGVNDAEFFNTFVQFYEGETFKYYTDLNYVKAKGGFEGKASGALAAALKKAWEKSSFADGGEATVTELLTTFDGIGDIFSIGAQMGIETFRAELLGKVSETIAVALGLTGMFNGVSSAMELSDEEVDKLLTEAGLEITPENRAMVRGNAAVLYFANDTAGRKVEDVQASVKSFTDAMLVAFGASYPDKSSFESDAAYMAEVKAYYLSVATAAEKETFNSNPEGQVDILYDFISNKAVACGEDFYLTGAQLVALSESTTGTNSTGITSLGAMYALAAGFYNNTDYYDAATMGGAPSNFGEFSAISGAMGVKADGTGIDLTTQTAFLEYCNSEAGKADLEAYLSFMDYLSSGDVDLTDSAAFAGQNEFILGALGK